MKLPQLLTGDCYIYRGGYAVIQGTGKDAVLLHQCWSDTNAIEWARQHTTEPNRPYVRIVRRGSKSDNFYNVPFDWDAEKDYLSYYNPDNASLGEHDRRITLSMLAKLDGAHITLTTGLVSIRVTLKERTDAGEVRWFIYQGKNYVGSMYKRNIRRIATQYGEIISIYVA